MTPPQVTNSMGWSDITMFFVGLGLGILGTFGVMLVYVIHRCKG